VAGHGLKISDDSLDVLLRQRIEVGHPGSSSNTGGVRNESAQEARIPVFRYAARRIQLRPECPSNAIDGMAFQAMRDEQFLTGLRAMRIEASQGVGGRDQFDGHHLIGPWIFFGVAGRRKPDISSWAPEFRRQAAAASLRLAKRLRHGSRSTPWLPSRGPGASSEDSRPYSGNARTGRLRDDLPGLNPLIRQPARGPDIAACVYRRDHSPQRRRADAVCASARSLVH
jgi:hypothetical protein